MNPVIHFELPFENRERMAEFYSKNFGWKSQMLGPDMGNYVVVSTSESSEDRVPKKAGMINGGFFERTKDSQCPTLVIAVLDIKQAIKKVTDTGGKILGGSFKAGEPDDIPGIGLYCAFVDTEGNRIALLQPKS